MNTYVKVYTKRRMITLLLGQDQVPQEIYDQMPERVRRKVQKSKTYKAKMEGKTQRIRHL